MNYSEKIIFGSLLGKSDSVDCQTKGKEKLVEVKHFLRFFLTVECLIEI